MKDSRRSDCGEIVAPHVDFASPGGSSRLGSKVSWLMYRARRVSAIVIVLLIVSALITIDDLQSGTVIVSAIRAAESESEPGGSVGLNGPSAPTSSVSVRAAAPPVSAQVAPNGRAGALRYGVLGGSCAENRVGGLRAAGVQLVEIDVDWALFEPAPQVFDVNYINELRNQLARCRTAGLEIVLNPGFQYAPSWVSSMPDGSYRNKSGDAGPVTVPNIIFSAAVRDAVVQYLARFAVEFPLATFAAIRLGTSESGELGYPRISSGGPGLPGEVWAFDSAAQTGDGLADGMEPSPFPGWAPGDSSWKGRSVTGAEVRRWFSWYSGSAAKAAIWEIGAIRRAGYRGVVQLPLAGSGVLPADLNSYVAASWGGGDPDGSFARGLYYPDQLAMIAAATRNDPNADPNTVVADVTSLDDSTAVISRGLPVREDLCEAGDAETRLRPDVGVESWSASRWTISNARAAGLRVVGENPGSPLRSGTGGDTRSDDLAQQLVHAPDYARSCGLDLLMWAFEDDLFTPSPAVSVTDLATRIAG